MTRRRIKNVCDALEDQMEIDKSKSREILENFKLFATFDNTKPVPLNSDYIKSFGKEFEKKLKKANENVLRDAAIALNKPKEDVTQEDISEVFKHLLPKITTKMEECKPGQSEPNLN